MLFSMTEHNVQTAPLSFSRTPPTAPLSFSRTSPDGFSLLFNSFSASFTKALPSRFSLKGGGLRIGLFMSVLETVLLAVSA